MEKVTGVGGVFFRAKDPARMAEWYREHLGIPSQNNYFNFVNADKTQTVWSLFPADTDYFGPTNPAFMVNYRVASLEKMLDQLRAHGIAIEKTEDYDYGRFAWITDPEGNRIELWEPKEA